MANSRRPSGAADDTGKPVTIPFDPQAETERLLAGRTRDIKFSAEMLEHHRKATWPQRSKIMRAWCMWVSIIGLVFIPISYLGSPQGVEAAIVAGAIISPIANLCLFLVWRKQRKTWVEGLSVVLLIAGTMVAYGSVGASIGGEAWERYITAVLFVAGVGITVFAVDFAWLFVMTVIDVSIFDIFILLNPHNSFRLSASLCMFYAMGMFAVFTARQTAIILAQKSFLMSLRDAYRSEALTQANRQLEMLATRDPLTGLANRRSANDRIAALWSDTAISRTSVAVVMADIDHFKKLNDAAGHLAGDNCLIRVARSIEASVSGEKDIVCRYGGEEFLIILTEVTQEMAWTLAERIRSGVEALAIVNPGIDAPPGTAGLVTVSVGVAFAQADAGPELAIKSADDALYDAKRSGRNRVFMPLGGESASPQTPDTATLRSISANAAI